MIGDFVGDEQQRKDAENVAQGDVVERCQQVRADDDADDRRRQQQADVVHVPRFPVGIEREDVAKHQQRQR